MAAEPPDQKTEQPSKDRPPKTVAASINLGAKLGVEGTKSPPPPEDLNPKPVEGSVGATLGAVQAKASGTHTPPPDEKKATTSGETPSKGTEVGINEDVVIHLDKDDEEEPVGRTVDVEGSTVVVSKGDVLEVPAADLSLDSSSTTADLSENRPSAFWLLPTDPESFDFRDKAPSVHTIPWSSLDGAEDLTEGDTVLFWLKGENGGIYGWGRINGKPREIADGTEVDVILCANFEFPIPSPVVTPELSPDHPLPEANLNAPVPVDKNFFDNMLHMAGIYGNSLDIGSVFNIDFALSDEIIKHNPWLAELTEEARDLGYNVFSFSDWVYFRIPLKLPFESESNSDSRAGITLFAINITGFSFAGLTYQLKLLELENIADDYLSKLRDFFPDTKIIVQPLSGDRGLVQNDGTTIPLKGPGFDWKGLLQITLDVERYIEANSGHILSKFRQWDQDPDSREINASSTPKKAPSVDAKIEETLKSLLPFLNIVNDKWTVEDALGYDDYAEAIAHFIKHKDTAPPLAISVQAPWGAGKTSLMRMIQKKLDPEALRDPPEFLLKKKRTSRPGPSEYFTSIEDILQDRRKNSEPELDRLDVENWITIWFNPWKYESSDQIWAGLADSITRQIGDRLSLFDREWFYLQLHLRRINIEKLRRKFLDRQIDRLPGALVYIASSLLIALAVPVEMVQETIKSIVPLFSFGPIGAGISGLLGTTALITKFWKSHITEEVNATKLSELVEVPDYNEKLGFRFAAEQDIKRIHASIPRDDKGKPKIAIFIDDLDRCSPSKIAKVFEAINLLVADDIAPCYFIIGMDGEIVSAALESHYEDLFSTIPTSFRTSSIGWHYLDKFVQLPFVIPPADPEKLKDLGREISKAQSPSTIALDDSEPGVKGNNKPPSKDAENTGNSEKDPSNSDEKSSEIPQPQPQEIAASKIIKDAVSEFEENVTDEIIARELIKETGWDFDNNPRTLKRCLNLARFHLLVRFLKERRDQYRQSLHDDQNQNETSIPEKEVVIQWIYFSFRWPDAARWVQSGNSELVEGACRKEKESGNQFTGLTSATRLNWLKENSTETVTNLIAWQTRLTGLDATKLETPPPEISWTNDRQLFDYCRSHDLGLLADNADKGFW